MKFRKYPSLARAAEALAKRGFSGRFLLDKNCLVEDKSGKQYEPEEVTIVEYHRFFPKSPDNSCISIIFALEAVDGVKGLLISTYDAYCKVDLLKFMDGVKIKMSTSNITDNPSGHQHINDQKNQHA